VIPLCPTLDNSAPIQRQQRLGNTHYSDAVREEKKKREKPDLNVGTFHSHLLGCFDPNEFQSPQPTRYKRHSSGPQKNQKKKKIKRKKKVGVAFKPFS
jgi:hypothetical protein